MNCRQPKQVFFSVLSIYITCFGRTHHLQAFKYMILKLKINAFFCVFEIMYFKYLRLLGTEPYGSWCPLRGYLFLIPVPPSLVYRLAIRRHGKGEGWGEGVQGFLFCVVASRHTLLVLLLAFGLRLGFDSGRPGAGSSALFVSCERATQTPRHVVRQSRFFSVFVFLTVFFFLLIHVSRRLLGVPSYRSRFGYLFVTVYLFSCKSYVICWVSEVVLVIYCYLTHSVIYVWLRPHFPLEWFMFISVAAFCRGIVSLTCADVPMGTELCWLCKGHCQPSACLERACLYVFFCFHYHCIYIPLCFFFLI